MSDTLELYKELGRLIEKVDSQGAMISSLDKKVDDLTALKHRGAGILVGVGIVASAIGSIITWYLNGGRA